MNTHQINLRLDSDTIDKMDELIKSGEFENRTAIIRYELIRFLKNWDGKRL